MASRQETVVRRNLAAVLFVDIRKVNRQLSENIMQKLITYFTKGEHEVQLFCRDLLDESEKPCANLKAFGDAIDLQDTYHSVERIIKWVEGRQAYQTTEHGTGQNSMDEAEPAIKQDPEQSVPDSQAKQAHHPHQESKMILARTTTSLGAKRSTIAHQLLLHPYRNAHEWMMEMMLL
jgi:hypothetical protein